MTYLAVLIWGCGLAAACGSTPLAPSPMAACRFPIEKGVPAVVEGRPNIQIVYHEGDGLGARLAADAATAFTAMSGVKFAPYAVTDVTDATVVLCYKDPLCPQHAIAVGKLALLLESHPPQGQTVRTLLQSLQDRRIWWLQGDGLLGQQYAVYKFLQKLGVRYYHPRATYYPSRQTLSIDRSVEVTEAPGFQRRGWHLNTAIPTEALRAFLEPGEKNLANAKQIIDWLVANGQNYVAWTLLETAELNPLHTHMRQVVAYARLRGLEAGISVSLNANPSRIYSLTGKDGGMGEMRDRLQALADDGFQKVQAGIHASPLRPLDHAQAIAWVAAFSEAIESVSPSLRGSLGVPSASFAPADHNDDIPIYQVARSAPATIGMDIGSVSFYSLFQNHGGASGVDIEHQLRFLEQEMDQRAISFSPQTSAWGGVDSDVPLFLPVYWYTRWQDANRLLAYPNIHGHLTVDTGWEWGYWVNDAMVFAATWAPQLDFAELVEQVLGPVGRNTCNRFTETLTGMATIQSDQLIGNLLAPYVTGQSASSVVFATAGFPLQPMRQTYAALLTLTPAAAVTFETEVLTPLMEHLEKWTAMERRLLPVIPRVDEAARPFVQEIVDGIGVTRLRLAHSVALLKSMQASQTGNPTAAGLFLDQARDQTNIASLMVAARESQYRYPVEDLAGIYPNPTAYPFGYLHAARSLRYWTEEEIEASRAIARSISASSLPK